MIFSKRLLLKPTFENKKGKLLKSSASDQRPISDTVVEPELLSYSSDVTCVTDVVVSKSFALSSK